MADSTIDGLNTISSVDRSTDKLAIWDASTSSTGEATINATLGISGNPVGTTDTQTLTNKTLTSPTISNPTLSGTVSGTYTLGGTPTFPSSVVTLTGAQTLTNKTLTSPVINTATISNPTLTVNTVSEHTAANGVTVDGLSIKDSKLNTNNSVVTANVTNAAITPDKLGTGAANATVNTAQTSASTSYTDLTTTTDTVTVTIGANGLALVSISALMSNTVTGGQCWVGVDISGATTQAAADSLAILYQTYTNNGNDARSGTYLLTGLNPGSTTFKMKYKVNANTGTWANRRIAVVPL